jgi:hypothetical protein
LPECGILQGIEQYYLSLHILNEPEKQVYLFLLIGINRMLTEELLNDLLGALLSLITILAIGQQQGKQDTGFLNPVKGKRGEKTVIKLELDGNVILKLMQAMRRLVIHYSKLIKNCKKLWQATKER